MKYNHIVFLVITGLISLFSCQENKKEDTTQKEVKKDTLQTKDTISTKPKPKKITMERDIHTFSSPEKVAMTALFLDISVDFDQKIIKGVAEITIDIKDKKAEEIILDTKGLDVEKVTLNEDEKPHEFTMGDEIEHLGQALSIKIKPDTKKIKVYYKTSPKAEALMWLSPEQTMGKKSPFLFTQSQAILARTWVPCQDSPGIRFTYTAKVSVPKDLLALMSAENPQKKNEEGVYEFKMPQAIPAYLLALSVGDLVYAELGKNTGVYAEPDMIKKAKYEFEEVEKMLEVAENLYGKYQWGRYDMIVLPPSFPFGGMENPRLTFATPTIITGDRSLTSLIAHELAHSWSGNLVTNRTWSDFWLNEGFTVYFERRIMEGMYGKSYAKMLEYLGYQDLVGELEELPAEDTKLKLDLKDRNPDDGVTSVAYEKGFFFLRMIEDAVGREKFDTFLKKYFEKFAFKTMNTQTFKQYLTEQLAGTDQLNLDEWIHEPGLPKNMPEVTSKRFKGVDKAIKDYLKKEKEADELTTKTWTSHEWQYFVRGLPEELTPEQIEALDKTFQFTKSGNYEVLFDWLIKVIPLNYEKAFPALEDFLMNVGRRKFIVPLYKALLKAKDGEKKAKEIYKKARPNYHAVATLTLDELLK